MNIGLVSVPSVVHSPFLLVGIGILLVIGGLLHLTPIINGWDVHTFLFLHTSLRRYVSFFSFIWPLGTTPVGITLILIMFIPGWQAGLIAALIYLPTAILEWAIKRSVNRPRPYESLSGVVVSQPTTPNDPSHPSGDTMRVWFLALIFPLAFGLSWPVFALTSSAALIISLGRIVMGVHYPLDVIGGTGLGIFATGAAMLSYNIAAIK